MTNKYQMIKFQILTFRFWILFDIENLSFVIYLNFVIWLSVFINLRDNNTYFAAV